MTADNVSSRVPQARLNQPRRGRTCTGQHACLMGLLTILSLTGCTAMLNPVSGVPAHRLPPDFLAKPKNNLQPIDISRLRQDPPRAYLIDARDILGIYVQGVLGDEASPPPFSMPAPGSNLPPAIGYPFPVRENGTISLPFVPPIPVRGLTVDQVENAIRRAYTMDQKILQSGKDRIIVSLMREREYQVIVMRRDGLEQGGGGGSATAPAGGAWNTQSTVIKLPAYQNDVLNALAKTGGLPGTNAKNEVQILRGRLVEAKERERFVRAFYEHQPPDHCLCMPPVPADPRIIRIPLRLPPGEFPKFRPTDVILEDGDVVLLEGRDREVFYTGGLLGGGEHALPRDYDLDVIGAMALCGYGPNQSGMGGTGSGMAGMGSSFAGVAPGQLFILRKTPCGDQIVIDVDLTKAVRDPRSRPLVQAGDTLMLQYRPQEELTNFALGTFFIYGIADLVRGRN